MKFNIVLFVNFAIMTMQVKQVSSADIILSIFTVPGSISGQVVCAANGTIFQLLSTGDVPSPSATDWNAIPFTTSSGTIASLTNLTTTLYECSGSDIFIIDDRYANLLQELGSLATRIQTIQFYISGIQQRRVSTLYDSQMLWTLMLNQYEPCPAGDVQWQCVSHAVTFTSPGSCSTPADYRNKAAGNVTINSTASNTEEYFMANNLYAPDQAKLLPGNITCNVGDTVQVTCTTANLGNPPAIKWQLVRSGSTTPLSTLYTNNYATFQLNIVSLNDAGYYYCLVSNILSARPAPEPNSVILKTFINVSLSSTVSPTVPLTTNFAGSTSHSPVTASTSYYTTITTANVAVTPPPSQFNLLYLIAIIGGALIVILIIVTVAACRYHRRKKHEEKTAEHAVAFENPVFGEGIVKPPTDSQKRREKITNESAGPYARPGSLAMSDQSMPVGMDPGSFALSNQTMVRPAGGPPVNVVRPRPAGSLAMSDSTYATYHSVDSPQEKPHAYQSLPFDAPNEALYAAMTEKPANDKSNKNASTRARPPSVAPNLDDIDLPEYAVSSRANNKKNKEQHALSPPPSKSSPSNFTIQEGSRYGSHVDTAPGFSNQEYFTAEVTF